MDRWRGGDGVIGYNSLSIWLFGSAIARVGLGLVEHAAAHAPHPFFAIGGIEPALLVGESVGHADV